MRSNRCTRRRRCIPKFTPKGATSPLERCGGTRHSKKPTRATVFSSSLSTKGKPRSTKGPLRVVTEPVQAWENSQVSSLRQLHNTEALKYKATRGYNTPHRRQGHQDTNAPQPAPKPQRLPHSTKVTTPLRLPRHKDDKATKATRPQKTTRPQR